MARQTAERDDLTELDDLIARLDSRQFGPGGLAKALTDAAAIVEAEEEPDLYKARGSRRDRDDDDDEDYDDEDEDEEEAPPARGRGRNGNGGGRGMPFGKAAVVEDDEDEDEDEESDEAYAYSDDDESDEAEGDSLAEVLEEMGQEDVYDANPVLEVIEERLAEVSKSISYLNYRIDRFEKSMRPVKQVMKSLARGELAVPMAEPEPEVQAEDLSPAQAEMVKSLAAGLKEMRERMSGVESAVSQRPHSPHPPGNFSKGVSGAAPMGQRQFITMIKSAVGEGGIPAVISREQAAQALEAYRAATMMNGDGTPPETILREHAPGALPLFKSMTGEAE